jgi:hypothetical protein
MGPFTGPTLAITDTHEKKVWVGTRRPGAHGRAELTVTGPDGIIRHYSRARASAPDFAAFYPGLIAVTEPGTWVVSAQVGPDRMCVLAHYR